MIFSDPKLIQHIADASSISYSNPIERNTRIVVESLDAFYVKVCREYFFGGYFGAGIGDRASVDSVTSRSNVHDYPKNIWTSDAEGALLVDGAFGTGAAFLDGMTTPGQVTLDKTQTDQTHVLEFAQDDQDDVLEFPLNRWPNGRQYGLPPGVTGMIFDIRKKESTAASLMQWCIKSTNSTPATTYWDDGAGAWTTVLADAWTDFLGNTSLTLESKTFNTQAYFKDGGPGGPPHSLMLRPKIDYAADICSIYSMSVYDSRVASQGIRVGTDATSVNRIVLDIPYRCRLGIITDSAVATTITEVDKLT